MGTAPKKYQKSKRPLRAQLLGRISKLRGIAEQHCPSSRGEPVPYVNPYFEPISFNKYIAIHQRAPVDAKKLALLHQKHQEANKLASQELERGDRYNVINNSNKRRILSLEPVSAQALSQLPPEGQPSLNSHLARRLAITVTYEE